MCMRERPLRLSHIVPAFAGKYLKETSATGYLRDGVNPNIRRQDLTKKELLCDECEQQLSAWEREFSIHAFPYMQDDGFRDLEYGDWLLKFAVSLSWRTLVSDQQDLVRDFPQFSKKIPATLASWRLFLLGERKQPGSEHHLFVIAGVPERVPPGLHDRFLHYFLRGMDATEVVGTRTVAVYVKLLRALFYAPIIPASPSGWGNTRIHAGHGRIVSPQTLAMRGFLDFVNGRVAEVHAKPLSDAQSAKIAEVMKKDPRRVAESESLKVELASRRLLHKRINSDESTLKVESEDGK